MYASCMKFGFRSVHLLVFSSFCGFARSLRLLPFNKLSSSLSFRWVQSNYYYQRKYFTMSTDNSDTTAISTKIIRIAVGSKNPVKVNAAKQGISKALFGAEVIAEGFDVPSGVSDQPMSDEETQQGGVTRCMNAFQAYKDKFNEAPDYAIGLEGGVMLSNITGQSQELECYAWMVIYNGTMFGKARTGAFLLPHVIRDLVVVDKLELGVADDRVFKTVNSKQKGGSVGQFTNGVIGRTEYYEHAIVLAFIPFNYPQLYDYSQEGTV